MRITQLLSAFALIAAVGSACAQTQSTTSRMYLFNPNAQDVQAALQGLENAIGARGRVAKQVNLIPSTLPDLPGEPVAKPLSFGPVSIMMLNCGDAYATVNLASDTGPNLLGNIGERFFGCLYLSKVGIRTAIVMQRYTNSNSLFGGIVSAIRDNVMGDDKQFGSKTFDQFRQQVQAAAPDTLVELLELPGGDISRPDGQRVAEILAAGQHAGAAPAAPVNPLAAALAAATGQALPPAQPPANAGGAMQAAYTPPAATPATPAAPASQAPSPATGVAAAIEARKQLSGMGLSYHSADQLADAIKRRDLIAVDLFAQAGALTSSAKNSKGQSVADLALQSGDAAIQDIVTKMRH